MNRIIVIQFITLDGVIEDPDGSAGLPDGGWAFRFGPEAVAGDKFKLGSRLDTGALLFGRHDLAAVLEDLAGAVGHVLDPAEHGSQVGSVPDAQRRQRLEQLGLIEGELTSEVQELRRERDVIVIGSTSVVHTLMERDLVDEYRLLIFPTVLGHGGRLFTGQPPVGDLRLMSAEQSGAGALLRYEKAER